MRDLLIRLLDEENRQADIVAFGQLVSLFIAVLVTLLLLVPSAISVIKTGKIDSNAVWILTVWLGSAATFGVADSRRANTTAPTPPPHPTPPQPPTEPKTAASPPPKEQVNASHPRPAANSLP